MVKVEGTSLYFIKEVEPNISKTNGRIHKMGLFKCKCGKKLIKRLVIKNGKYIKSCNKCKVNSHVFKHGKIKHELYRKWQDMKKRCYNENVDRYCSYGALGITVCDEWVNDFINFYDWSISNGWVKGLTIDRIDVNGNYSPLNCRYITRKEQLFNKRNTIYVELDDSTNVSLKELLYRNGKEDLYKKIWSGMKRGLSIDYYIKKDNLSVNYIFISKKIK